MNMGEALSLLALAVVTGAACSFFIGYFYGFIGEPPFFPKASYRAEVLDICKTGFIASFIASSTAWLLIRGKNQLKISDLIKMTVCIQGLLSLYAVWAWQAAGNMFFPLVIFAETNWLSFVFEIAPCTSLFVSGCFWLWRRMAQR